MSRRVFIKTFGCQMNERDSEIMEQLLASCGYVSVFDMEEADFVLLNTCSIRAKAEQKVFSLLGQLRKQKIRNPGLLVGVAGCVAQQEGSEIFKRMPHVDLVVGTQQFYQLPAMLRRLKNGESTQEISCNLSSAFTIPPLQKYYLGHERQAPSPAPANRHAPVEVSKFVTIMQGCNNYCSYCVVPFTRGREVSRKVSDIVEEITLLVAGGVKEITLLGQNVNSYGSTNPVADTTTGFADLLQRVAEIPGIERLRFTSSNPQDLSTELMQCFRDIEILCPHFHLPAQSGSNSVLKKMGRRYTRELYLEKVEELRSYCPEIAISTDIIVGFPGESDQDFAETMDLLQTVRYHGSFSFKYSDRPGTRSADFGHKVDEKIKGERLQCFQQEQDKISLERNQEMVGKTMEVMIEHNQDGTIKSRTGSNHIVHFTTPEPLIPGDLCQVRIVHAGMHSLGGEYRP
ncbi:MAG TPA: tRNA (N6-isopentenyl adenosine(37)-C2)-methylthiotransferase MiaB [Desulfobulbus sp.]|nr:tRNA (N6-isopentenyl adenosine(37)-C2)-methylthiotransferase MiaB [Desulfobulbus sp.]